MARPLKPIRIVSENDLKLALADQPREWSIAIAHRAALRVTPLWRHLNGSGVSREYFESAILALFRCSVMPTARGPTRLTGALEAALIAFGAINRAYNAASPNVDDFAAVALAAASACARVALAADIDTDAGTDAADAASEAVDARSAFAASETTASEAAGYESIAKVASARSAAWREIEWDFNALRARTTIAALRTEPIGLLVDDAQGWLTQSDPFPETWRAFKEELHAADPHWALWTEWWEAMRDGERAKPLIWGLPRAAADALLTSAALWPETKWTQLTPKEVNAEIWALIEAKRQEFAGADDVVEQGEGPYRFEEVDGRIVGRPGTPDAFDEAFAATLREELVKKLEALLPAARASNTTRRVVNGLERLREALGVGIAEVNPGVLLSTSRTVLNDTKAFSTSEARNENQPEVLSALGDVADSLEDLMAAFPSILRIEKERLAIALLRNRRRLDAQRKQIEQIQKAADENGAVDASARLALHRFDAAVNEAENLDLLAALVADQILVVRAFTAQVANSLGRRLKDPARVVVSELSGLGIDLWKSTRTGLPVGWKEGSKRLGKRLPQALLVILGISIAGPVGALAGTNLGLGKVATKLAGWIDELRKAQALENEVKRRTMKTAQDKKEAPQGDRVDPKTKAAPKAKAAPKKKAPPKKKTAPKSRPTANKPNVNS